MLLADVVATSAAVASTRSRTAKVAALAALLAKAAPAEVEAVVGFLVGQPRQGRIGVGWATVQRAETAHATVPTLTVGDLDQLLDSVQTTTGAGSVGARTNALGSLLERATPAEADFVRRLLTGELRQGALGGLMADAVAVAAEVPASAVRRAVLLGGDLGQAAVAALSGGVDALATIRLVVGQPLSPMLASPADSVTEALGAGASPARAIGPAASEPASVEWKLDGIRIQAHRDGDDVALFTRNLNDVTARLPDVVELIRSLPGRRLVLDGEVVGVAAEGDKPHLFQDVMAGFGREDHKRRNLALRPLFFDCLHLDGEDLIDRPLAERLAALDQAVGSYRIPRIVTADPAEAEAFFAATVAAGHEGVMVKTLASLYDAGRRGKAWRKVKPVKTLDLVVLAAEWGHGRRRGWLSNLHLGARDPARAGTFVMVGKTFKGLTDALLTWQTEQLQNRIDHQDAYTVFVRPELVVEIELDGVQVSTRYPGGVALRFARVLRYRPDKQPAQADTIDAVRALLAR